VLQRDPQLLEIVLAGAPPRCLAGRLHGRQQEADERADDGDHHQELDQRKAVAAKSGSPIMNLT
jgi:hypothetical protein